MAPLPVRFVLVHPRTPENLGSAARALKNFGQRTWTWVRPPWSPEDPRARALAVDAEDVLAAATLADSFDAAVADATWVVGTTGRTDVGATLTPEAFAREARRRGGRTALVFGDERTGLSARDLGRCHALTRVPTDVAQPSLNLAQAVCLYAHALFRDAVAESDVRAEPRPGAVSPAAEDEAPGATDAALTALEARLAEVLAAARFVRPGTAGVRDLVRPWRRAGLSAREVRLWETALRSLARTLGKAE